MGLSKSYDRTISRQMAVHLLLNEAVGAISVLDVAKPHHPMTQSGTPAWMQLPSGLWVMSFTSSHPDYLKCLTASCTDLEFNGGNFSGVLWAKPSAAATHKWFMHKCTYVSNDWATGFCFRISSDAPPRIFFTTATPVMTTGSNQIVVNNAWALFGFTKSVALVRIYMNGLNVTSSTATHSTITASQDFYVGRGDPATGNFNYDGQMGQPRIWGRALNPQEHMEIFNRERHLFGV